MRRFSILLGSIEREKKLTRWLEKYNILWCGGTNIKIKPIVNEEFYSIEFNYIEENHITYSKRNLFLDIPKYTMLNDSIKDKINNIPLITEEMFREFMEIK